MVLCSYAAIIIKCVTYLPNRQGAVNGNSVPSSPCPIIFSSKDILKPITLFSKHKIQQFKSLSTDTGHKFDTCQWKPNVQISFNVVWCSIDHQLQLKGSRLSLMLLWMMSQ